MSGEVVNLTALQEVRAKMTPGVLEVCCPDQPESHPCRLVWRDQAEPAFSLTRDSDEGLVPKADVAGFAATHNAADVLIEVARCNLLVRSADNEANEATRAWVEASMATATTQAEHEARERDVAAKDGLISAALQKVEEAKAVLALALAKVKL